MTVIAFRTGGEPVDLEVGPALGLSDDELLELSSRNPDLRLERTAGGDLVVMTPAGGASGHRNLEIAVALGTWTRADGTGVAFDSSTGFLLPDGSLRAPDAAWVRRSRLADLPPEARERYLPLAPDFAVELRSPTDDLADLQAKLAEYRDHGTRLGWLIDPVERRVHVYRPGRDPEVLNDPGRIAGDPELPGFILELEPIFRPL